MFFLSGAVLPASLKGGAHGGRISPPTSVPILAHKVIECSHSPPLFVFYMETSHNIRRCSHVVCGGLGVVSGAIGTPGEGSLKEAFEPL